MKLRRLSDLPWSDGPAVSDKPYRRGYQQGYYEAIENRKKHQTKDCIDFCFNELYDWRFSADEENKTNPLGEPYATPPPRIDKKQNKKHK